MKRPLLEEGLHLHRHRKLGIHKLIFLISLLLPQASVVDCRKRKRKSGQPKRGKVKRANATFLPLWYLYSWFRACS